eukprot:gene588-2009_t
MATAYLSEAGPAQIDRKLNNNLRKFLEEMNLYETLEESQYREEVLGKLAVVIKEWTTKVMTHYGYASSTVEDANVVIKTFGSYSLGVQNPGADIDTVLLGTKWISRENDFFGTEDHCLQKILTDHQGSAEVNAVPEAYVPVIKIKKFPRLPLLVLAGFAGVDAVPEAYVPVIKIKFMEIKLDILYARLSTSHVPPDLDFMGIELDILYARLSTSHVPPEIDVSENKLLRGCDEQSVRALNGCRVSDAILSAVPNKEAFRMTLKAVKLWAERRGVYSNVLGYLGGINWAILVAKAEGSGALKYFPNFLPSMLLQRFLKLMSDWNWPTAISLKPIERNAMGFNVWSEDEGGLMPIVTPAYPAMNSSYNVSRCTLEVMLGEFRRASALCNGLKPASWPKVFEPYKFFEVERSFYLQIAVSAASEEEFIKWDGWVKSRLRLMVRNMEEHLNARPLPDAMKDPSDSAGEEKVYRKYYYLCLTRRTATPPLTDIADLEQVAQQVNQINGVLEPVQQQYGAQQQVAPKSGRINIQQPVAQFRQQTPCSLMLLTTRVEVLGGGAVEPASTISSGSCSISCNSESASTINGDRTPPSLMLLATRVEVLGGGAVEPASTNSSGSCSISCNSEAASTINGDRTPPSLMLLATRVEVLGGGAVEPASTISSGSCSISCNSKVASTINGDRTPPSLMLLATRVEVLGGGAVEPASTISSGSCSISCNRKTASTINGDRTPPSLMLLVTRVEVLGGGAVEPASTISSGSCSISCNSKAAITINGDRTPPSLMLLATRVEVLGGGAVEPASTISSGSCSISCNRKTASTINGDRTPPSLMLLATRVEVLGGGAVEPASTISSGSCSISCNSKAASTINGDRTPPSLMLLATRVEVLGGGAVEPASTNSSGSCSISCNSKAASTINGDRTPPSLILLATRVEVLGGGAVEPAGTISSGISWNSNGLEFTNQLHIQQSCYVPRVQAAQVAVP